MRAPAHPLVINGSYGEGGGALLRTAIAMSALTQQAVRIHSIRGAMRRNGLTSEDLTYLRILEACVDADLSGDEPSKNELYFAPNKLPRPVRASFDIQSHEKGTIPGNALIAASSAIPVLAKATGYSRLVVEGETYNPNTITFDAFERSSLPALARMGIVAFANQPVAGFGFAARGEIGLEVEPSTFVGGDFSKRGSLVRCGAVIAHSSGIKSDIVTRGEKYLEAQLQDLRLDGEVESRLVDSKSDGVFVTVYAQFERGFGVGTAIGARSVRMETVAQNALDSFLSWFNTDAAIDPFLVDQLLIPAALCDEPTLITTNRLTQRVMTMAFIIKQFLPIHVTITGREGEPGTIKISR